MSVLEDWLASPPPSYPGQERMEVVDGITVFQCTGGRLRLIVALRGRVNDVVRDEVRRVVRELESRRLILLAAERGIVPAFRYLTAYLRESFGWSVRLPSGARRASNA